MSAEGRRRVVVLGMMTKTPVGGVVWQTLHYLLGFERLGYDAYYVEAHARTPSMLMEREDDDGSARAAAFIDSVLRRFGLGDRWAFHALHDDRVVYGMSERALARLYRSAALLLNLHGGTEPLPEHASTGRLVYVETDPVQLQVELHEGLRQTVDFLEPHVAFFTFAENYGEASCGLPVDERFRFHPTRQPVLPELWMGAKGEGSAFTTVGNWRQQWRDVFFGGERYTWSKEREFTKFLDLPARTGAQFELALASYEAADRVMLESKGWRVRDALEFSTDVFGYRDYVFGSRGEFTVAKDQNVRLRTGWFSDRSASYLAAGRPVVTQETGFSDRLPIGQGLFGVSDLQEAVDAVARINREYDRNREAAFKVAREYFDARTVLGDMLEEVGLAPGPTRKGCRADHPFHPELDLTVVSRRPTTLREETVAAVCAQPLPRRAGVRATADRPDVTVVVVVRDGLPFVRLCLESVLANSSDVDLEVLVVDNGSSDVVRDYLSTMSDIDPRLRLVPNAENHGFSHGVNQGLELAGGDVLVVLNPDTIVPPGWLHPLLSALDDESIGLVGPTTNEAGNEAEIEIGYRTYGELVRFARERARTASGRSSDIQVATMFCAALRREVFEQVGPLDERFEVGLFEDDDYSLRVKAAGFRVVCVEDAFVHHFGEAALGELVTSGEHGRIFRENRRRFEEKWLVRWKPHERRPTYHYRQLVERLRAFVNSKIPDGAIVVVASKGDERLVSFDGREGWHFPQDAGGGYAGHYPGTSEEAIQHLEALIERGADFLLFPSTALWWLEHYERLAAYLDARDPAPLISPGVCRVFRIARCGLRDDVVATTASALSGGRNER